MKKVKGFFITIGTIALIICIGPLDIFNHGFYCDMEGYNQIYEEDIKTYPLLEQSYEQVFTPARKHFAGFSLNMGDIEGENPGELILRIYNHKGIQIDLIVVNLKTVKSGEWHQVYMGKQLNVGEIYSLQISTQNRYEPLQLKIVNADYLPVENVKGNLLLGYAYSESTFQFQEKVLIILFLIAMWFFLIKKYLRLPFMNKNVGKGISCFFFLTILLTGNYLFNFMNHGNTSFTDFHAKGETLVMGCIYAEHEGVSLHEYGLGRYSNIKGTLTDYTMDFKTDENWDCGYSRTYPMIAVSNNLYTRRVLMVGYTIRFGNGDEFIIEDTVKKGRYLYVTLSAEGKLLKNKYGNLSEIRVLDQEGNLLKRGKLEDYQSQYGLQGKVFRTIARYIDYENVLIYLRLLCSLGTAIVFVLLVLMIAYKYNKLLAFSFYIVFWLSPWVVNFAHNLYWVEFSWFLPMLIGIVCSVKIESRRCRLFSYGAVLVAVMGKSLCGYEYITNVMLGGIVFFILDFINAILEKDLIRARLIFYTVFWFGLFSLLGFFIAICIHGELRGNGDVLAGIQSIIDQDVLRRVGGREMSNFDEVYWDSLNASIWETIGRYFYFSTEIIAGIPGNLFPLLSSAPIGIFIYNYKKKIINWNDIWMYLVFFAISISWFVLAKPHSYIHLHLNYVLWYFGFIQICIYIICKQVIRKDKNHIKSM